MELPAARQPVAAFPCLSGAASLKHCSNARAARKLGQHAAKKSNKEGSKMSFRWLKRSAGRVAGLFVMALILYAQTVVVQDPGPREGGPDAGGPIANITVPQFNAWLDGGELFGEVFSVSGTLPGEPGVGLGPGFNGNFCEMCHATPAPGGTGPNPASVAAPGTFFPQFGDVPNNAPNQQVQLATLDGAKNNVPSFITLAGPTREARFIFLADGVTHDGGVHDLYSIHGRSDAPNCAFAQNDFSDLSNIIFRIPTPTFGVGLVENTPDLELVNNLAANAVVKSALQISGQLNRSGNDGTVTRFGWKAQNKTLLMFSGEASNVEMGVTNELFANERFPLLNQQISMSKGCTPNGTPEDVTGLNLAVQFPPPPPQGNPDEVSSLITQLAIFMRLNAPPTAHPGGYSTAIETITAAQIAAGRSLFDIPAALVPGTATLTSSDPTDPTIVPDSPGTANGVGCALCHTPSLTTSKSPFLALNSVTFAPFSDFAVHNMGSGLADSVSQGAASGSQFRTAPLWGVGQRIFFLHDGRTQDLLQAIELHSSTGSEANAVIARFNLLTPAQQNDLLAFLRSL
jgi:CxxC motif-containing protein (DUF1111 family)